MVAISGLVGAGHGRRARSIGPVRRSGIEVGLARQATHGADQHATEPRAVTPPARGPAHSPSAKGAGINPCCVARRRHCLARAAVLPGRAATASWHSTPRASSWRPGRCITRRAAIRRKLPCQPQAPLRPRSSSWSAQTEYSRLLTEQSHARAPGSKAWQQWLQVLLDRSKQDRVIDAEITVDDAIPHSGHRRPWNVRICRLQRLWQVPDRLAQNLISRITA